MLFYRLIIVTLLAGWLMLTGSYYSLAKYQQEPVNSVLSEGNWYKFGVTSTGVYKIDFTLLEQAGIQPGQIDPATIRIYGNGGQMLPQKNSEPRPVDLIENAIFVKGEEDGVFNNDDFILFFGTDPDTYNFETGNGEFYYENNVYSDTSYYFLNFNETSGLRILDHVNEGDSFNKITVFEELIAYEKDLFNILQHPTTFFGGSGREWYGEKFQSQLTRDFPFSIPGITESTNLKIVASVLGASTLPSKFIVSANGFVLGEQELQSIPGTTYGVKGIERSDTFEVSSTLTGSELNITLEYEPSGTGFGHLNYLFLTAKRTLAKYEGQTLFRSIESLQNNQSTFIIENAGNDTEIWDVTDPLKPKKQNFTLSNNVISFGTSTSQVLREFIVFDYNDEFPNPVFSGKVVNQDLHGKPVSDLVIITNPLFIEEANRLADFRRSNDNLTVNVVTTNQVFNEFSSGSIDPTAIRDYMKYLNGLGNNTSSLKYLLLFGRTTYDYKNFSPDNTNFVPSYTSRNSLHPLKTYSSDDYYGFLDDDEGAWEEDLKGDHILDIGIGRLPVKSKLEASKLVDKLIHYSSNLSTLGQWKNDVYFVADDGDFNIHQRQANQLADFVDTAFSEYNPQKIFLDAFPQEISPGVERAPDANDKINDIIDRGALIINFTGHGDEDQWTQERILDINMINQWNNYNSLPLFVTATCEFGRHDDPYRISGGELTVLNPEGGGIALVTTARPVFSSTNFNLNKAFYSSVFTEPAGQKIKLGDVFKETKNNSLNGPNNRNFSLLGDPSMTLAYPDKNIIINEINDKAFQPGQDTVSALEKTTIRGIVAGYTGQTITNFNGKLYVSIFDKQQLVQTLGNEGPAFTYKDRVSTIYRGQASILNGNFEFSFVVPKDIDFKIDEGKVSMYGSSDNTLQDANGATIDLFIGGSSENAPNDNSPPEIQLFLEDTTFVSGGTTGSNTLLIAKLSDENGINISQAAIGHEIVATLDEDRKFILNDFYISELDNHQVGWVTFPLENLSNGKHTLNLKAWDTHNNSGEALIEFFVENEENFVIKNLRNYPNPFKDKTTFTFEHNRSGEDLQIELFIYSRTGQIIKKITWQVKDSNYRIDGIEWDGSNNFSEKIDYGLYIYGVHVRSLKDGAKNRKYQRLLKIN